MGQRLLILIILSTTLLHIVCTDETDKNDDLCRAAGGKCKAVGTCGPQEEWLSGQLCRGHPVTCDPQVTQLFDQLCKGQNLICCKQTDSKEVFEKRNSKRWKRAPMIKKKSDGKYYKNSYNKEFNTNIEMGHTEKKKQVSMTAKLLPKKN